MQVQQYKRIAVIVAVIVCSTLTWWVSHAWLSGPHPFTDVSTYVWPTLALVLLGAVGMLACVFVDHWTDWLAFTLASWASFIIFWSPDIWYLTVLPVFVLYWYEAWRRTRNDLSDRRKVRMGATLGIGMKMLLLGTYLMVSLGFFLLPSTRNIDIGQISSNAKEQVNQAYDNPLVRSQLESDQFPTSFRQQAREDLLKRVDLFIRNWVGPLGPFIPPILAFVLFLSLWSVSFIFRELAIWLGIGLFALLKTTGFVRVEEADVKAEVIRL